MFCSRVDENVYLNFMRDLKEDFVWRRLFLTSRLDTKSITIDDSNYLTTLCKCFDLVHIAQRYPDEAEQKYYSVAEALKDASLKNLEFAIDRLIQ